MLDLADVDQSDKGHFGRTTDGNQEHAQSNNASADEICEVVEAVGVARNVRY